MVDIQYISRAPSIWLNPFFYIAIGMLLVLIFYIIYHYVIVHYKNRTIFRIHMPDGSIVGYSFKKGEIGTELKIKGVEKTQDGTPTYLTYFFRPECLERGKWGDYIDYDYGNPEPLNVKKRQQGIVEEIDNGKFISSLLDTDLAVDLLLSQKFKDFVKMMLVLIIIAVVIDLALSGFGAFNNPVVNCNLLPSNQTINTLRIGLGA